MAKVLMSAIYTRIKERQENNLSLAKAEKIERLSYPFKAFQQDLRCGDLLTTTPSIKNKWDTAIADGVIEEIPGRRYARAFLNIAELEYKGHFYIRPSAGVASTPLADMQEASE